MEQLKTIEYAAERLGLRVKHVYHLIGKGVIGPPVVCRVGRKIRINVLELETWILDGGNATSSFEPPTQHVE